MTLAQFLATQRSADAIVIPAPAGIATLGGLPPLESLEAGKPVYLRAKAGKARSSDGAS